MSQIETTNRGSTRAERVGGESGAGAEARGWKWCTDKICQVRPAWAGNAGIHTLRAMSNTVTLTLTPAWLNSTGSHGSANGRGARPADCSRHDARAGAGNAASSTAESARVIFQK